jgi:CRISPR/Cas system-associated endonuclease/helicase Cas3
VPEGGVDADIAGMHAFISMGLQIAAFAVRASLESTIITTTATMPQRAAVFIFKFFNPTHTRRERERERQRERQRQRQRLLALCLVQSAWNS